MFPLPDSSWVGDVEFVECFAPSHDALSFDEACGLVAALAGLLSASGAFAGAPVFDVDDRQPEQFDDGVVALGKCPRALVTFLSW